MYVDLRLFLYGFMMFYDVLCTVHKFMLRSKCSEALGVGSLAPKVLRVHGGDLDRMQRIWTYGCDLKTDS